MEFEEFAEMLKDQFAYMSQHTLYVVDIDRDILWDAYLDAFPAGGNEIFRTRREFDCGCCRHFIKNVGNVVAIIGDQVVSIWDVNATDKYGVVAGALNKMITESEIANRFFPTMQVFGSLTTKEITETTNINWNHFYCNMDVIDFGKMYPGENIQSLKTRHGAISGETKTTYDMGIRAFVELDKDAIENILELALDNNIHRAPEYVEALKSFYELKVMFDAITDEKEQKLFVWKNIKNFKALRIRNTVIGTLLVDVSEGMDVIEAVNAYEHKTAGENFKRPKALTSKKLVNDAMNWLEEEGFLPSLERQHIGLQIIPTPAVYYINNTPKATLNGSLHDELMKETKVEKLDKSKAKPIVIGEFLSDVVKKATEIEMYMENRLSGNLVSVIGPKHQDSKNIFKWDNPYSWSYNGNVADSIAEKVKKAGGNIDGEIRVSLRWLGIDDLDLHCVEQGPRGNAHIYFNQNSRRSPFTSGMLDIDMNAHDHSLSDDSVENIFWGEAIRAANSKLTFIVHNYRQRDPNRNNGFELEVFTKGKSVVYTYDKFVSQNEEVPCVTIDVDGAGECNVTVNNNALAARNKSEDLWGIRTNDFVKVKAILNSPNFWEGVTHGNQHYLFALEDCKNPDEVRGIYNEFLGSEFNQFRKVLEVVGEKTKCPVVDEQVSGLGFPVTKDNEVFCKVYENKKPTLYKIKF